MTVVIYGVVMAIVGGLPVFKKYPIVTKQDMIDRGAQIKINLLCIVVTKKVLVYKFLKESIY